MQEIFDQVEKDRKQIFKPADRPCEDLKRLEETVRWHLDQHERTKRRWKLAGLITVVSVVVLALIVSISFLIAMYLTKVNT